MSEAPKVSLRPLNENDDSLIATLNDQVDVIAYLGKVARIPDEPPAHIRSIESDGIAIGVVGLVRSQLFDGSDVELACALLTAHEGDGIGPEACEQLLTDEKEKGDLDRVLRSIAPRHFKAQGLARRLGFVQIGVRPFSDEEIWELRIKNRL